MPRLLGLSLSAVLAAFTLLAVSATQALANHVGCGDVITQDTWLDSDLVDCPGNGIVIGADGVTLDLNGHLIDGVSVASGVHNPGWDGITIKDGTIRQFSQGVALDHPASNNTVRRVAVASTVTGIELFAGLSLVRGNSLSNAGVGIDIYGPDNRVIGNDLDGNSTGIRSHATSELVSEISNNTVVNNLGSGILLVETENNHLSGNLILNNGTQQDFPHGAGVTMFHVDNTSVERNVIAGNDLGIKLALYGSGNRLRRNWIWSNGVDGILAFEGTHDNLIDNNVAGRNGDDGIDIDDTEGDTLRRNHVYRNGDLGIEAAPGTIDGGGNRAFGNGNALQCLNVACR